MDGMVEENGTSGAGGVTDALAAGSSGNAAPHVVVTSIMQISLPTQAPSAQVFIYIFIYLAYLEIYDSFISFAFQ